MSPVIVRCTPRTGGTAVCAVECHGCGVKRRFAGPHASTNHLAAGAYAVRHAGGDHTEETP